MVLDLKILMYRNVDEIGKLQKIKANSERGNSKLYNK